MHLIQTVINAARYWDLGKSVCGGGEGGGMLPEVCQIDKKCYRELLTCLELAMSAYVTMFLFLKESFVH